MSFEWDRSLFYPIFLINYILGINNQPMDFHSQISENKKAVQQIVERPLYS